jgi:hypothetical protein
MQVRLFGAPGAAAAAAGPAAPKRARGIARRAQGLTGCLCTDAW